MHLPTSRLILSLEAICWVFKQDVKPSSLKFVLVALANFTNADGKFWPSIAALEQITSQDRKTIIQSVSKLEELGFIKDTGKRVGTTGQIKVYVLNWSNDTKSGTVLPIVGQTQQIVPKTEPLNSTVFTSKSTVFPYNSTENGTRNLKEPFNNLASCQEKIIKGSKGDFCETWEEEKLPYEWATKAEKIGIPDEQIYKSWRKFKDTVGLPYELKRWVAWISNERI